MLRTDDLDYPLPEELLATTPASPRDSARLLVVSRTDPARMEHRVVSELAEVLAPGTPMLRMGSSASVADQDATRSVAVPRDLMIVNATRVLPARFKGVREDTGGGAEGLYLGPASPTTATGHDGSTHWTALLKMRRSKPGVVVRLHGRTGEDSGVRLHLVERTGEDGAAWIVRVEAPPGESSAALARVGLTPLPPYILASRKRSHLEVPDDRDRAAYQTVYATDRGERPGHGSVAAPTAGLHFTPELLGRLQAAGVRRAEVTLDVSLGTFKPVETEFIEQHPMHAEWCHVPEETARAISATDRCSERSVPVDIGAPPVQSHGRWHGRVIAIGTTAARTLESFDSPEEMLRVGTKETRLLITPGYKFKHVDALLTNFHLPRSTLLAMVAAFLAPPADPEAGVARLKAIYAEAIERRYRFYSYGDAMLVLP